MRLLNQICPESSKGTRPLHHTEKYLQIVNHAGAVVHDAREFKGTNSQTEGQGGGSHHLRLGLCAGAEYGPAKRWPIERFAEAANQISERLKPKQSAWFLFGAPGETAMGEALASRLEVPHQNRIGKTSLSELIAELQNCDLLLTNDTGTMHLAAALGVQTVSIFGSTEPSLTGPIGDKHVILRHHVPCSPCFKRECPFGHYDCMVGMSVEKVTDAVLRVLA
jgi:lipopolysaccharide heptosyltransferase II